MKKIVYLARIDKKTFPGIFNKIEQTVKALNDSGCDATIVLGDGVGDAKSVWRSMWKIFSSLIFMKADIFIVRIDIFMPLLFFGIFWRRICGGRVIAEVPTPIGNWINEIKYNGSGSKARQFVKLILVYISFPWSLYPVNKVIQYAPESIFFSFGLKKKIQLVANGIDVDKFSKRKNFPGEIKNEFVMVGVASFAIWHGFDRILFGISEYLKKHSTDNVAPTFIIVGDGPIRKNWEQLCVDLKITDYVHFTGLKTGRELDIIFDKAHVAISSLGLYRIQLDMSSTLKSREYTARGMPFVQAGYDIDFVPVPQFVYQVANDNSAIDIKNLIGWYQNLKYDKGINKTMRKFSEKKLSYVVKAKELIE